MRLVDPVVGPRRRLLERFMADAPFQPATNLWRSVELPVLASALPRTGTGLDVGCGDGVLTGILRDLVGADWTLVGIDPDPAEIELARDKPYFARLHVAPASAIPEPEGSFDFAFANSVLEHIPNLIACLPEIARCLKPGGLFVASVPSAHFHACLAGPGLTRWQTRREYAEELDRRLAHVHYWTGERWEAELRRAGLEPEPSQPYLARSVAQRWETVSEWTGGLLYRLGGRRSVPIQIQRRYGMRRKMPAAVGRVLARPLAAAVGFGVLQRNATAPGDNAGLLVRARKPLP